MPDRPSILALETGDVFYGFAFGADVTGTGEVVFNTSKTGYQEISTDASYRGQLVVMTCSHIGNYGITRQDVESRQIWAEAFLVREACRTPSNWRSHQSLHDYLSQQGVVGIEGIDTRYLTRHLREYGAQPGVISHVDLDPDSLIKKAKIASGTTGRDLVSEVTCEAPYELSLIHI